MSISYVRTVARAIACSVPGLVIMAHAAFAEISACRFNFGTPYSGTLSASIRAEMDFVSAWAGYDENYSLSGIMRACSPTGALYGKTPVLYSYIIAFTLRRDYGLQDCDVGATKDLCDSAAIYLRMPAVRARIMGQYAKYARGTAADLGTTTPVVWMMEPDFYQYAQAGSQSGQPLTFAEAQSYLHEFLDTISAHLPNALFSLDISPWTAYNATTNRNWYTGFNLSRFTYVNTSGGRTNALGPAGTTQIRSDPMTWKSIHDLTGKPILADDGYGVAGASIGHDSTWDELVNLNNRIADGVISINQANPRPDWGAVIAAVRPQLNALPGCNSGIILRIRPVGRGERSKIFRDVLGRKPRRPISIRWNPVPLTPEP